MEASKELSENLQQVLVDLIELHLQGKQTHWNVVGKNFRDLHQQLDELVAVARAYSDRIAERMRALHAVPDGRTTTVSASTHLDPFPVGLAKTQDVVDLIGDRLEQTVGTVRGVHDQVDEEDPTTSDLLHEIIASLEQLTWMIEAENMVPGTAKNKSPRTAKTKST